MTAQNGENEATMAGARHILVASQADRDKHPTEELIEILDVFLRDMTKIRGPGCGRITVELSLLRNGISSAPSTV